MNVRNNLLEDNKDICKCYIANDNSNGQTVLSGLNQDIDKLIDILKTKKINKNKDIFRHIKRSTLENFFT